MGSTVVGLHRYWLAGARIIVFGLEEFLEHVVWAIGTAPHSDPYMIEVAAAHAREYLPNELFGIGKAIKRRDERGVRRK